MFHRFKVLIGVAREGVLDAKRRAAKAEREKKVADTKDNLAASIKKHGEQITEASEAVVKAEKEVAGSAAKGKDMSAQQMVALATEIDSLLEEASSKVKAEKETVGAMDKETEPELKAFLVSENKRLLIF